MANENIAAIQQQIVAGERAKQIAHQRQLAKDIRSEIARSGWYEPKNDPEYNYVPFPRWVEVWGGDGKKKDVLVQNAEEEKQVLGVKTEPAKAVTVDTNQLEKIVQAAPAKRGRPPKAKAAPLPPTLE